MTPLERACAEVLETGQPVTEEYAVPGAGGTRFLEIQVAPVGTADSAPSATVVVIRDITRRRGMERDLQVSMEDNRVLMMEVHHRVRNNLQIVSSLLQMQGWRVSDPQFRSHFDEACGRILALSKVHEMLYKEESLAAVDFGRYVRSLCEELFKMYGVREDRVSLSLDDGGLVLALDKAMPLALIVHELTTGLLKHSDNRQGGQLRLAVRAEGDVAVVEVADEGEQPEADGDPSSLGMRMVAVLAKQIHGTVSESRKGGTRFVVRFPLTEAAGHLTDEALLSI
jgi:two-component sensor histidine kinase